MQNRIREIRLAKGLTQEKIAPLAGLKQCEWSRLERRKNISHMAALSLRRVADALGVSIDELVANKTPDTP